MKKINSKGFILAETLIVSVFLMSIFTMIYVNFYPLIGEYEKRENYDDVDGKYTAYWIKKLVESSGYELDTDGINMMNKFGYVRFECSDMSTENNQREMCISLVNSLEISNCDSYGNGCDAYITRYTIGDSPLGTISFKNTIRTTSIKRWNEACISTSDPFAASTATTTCAANAFKECCRQKGLSSCENPVLTSSEVSYESLYSDDTKTEDKTNIAKYCNDRLTKKAFTSPAKDYVLSLPNYSINHSTTSADYRVIVVVRHKKDNNDYYSFSTMEVIK
ncbi:MAG: hypothetical protein IKQ06_06340 [Bacilli bacterium]|nr:hypothetical protein [Bacilli bacterium]MBR6137757.1 hypothetical protein [Bacilli bacterium]